MDSVFTSHNPFFIFGLVFLLIFLGAFEAVYNRSKKRYDGMVHHSTCMYSFPVFDCTVESQCRSLYSWTSRCSICPCANPYLGTHETHTNCWHATRKCHIWGSNRIKPLFVSSCVSSPSRIRIDKVPIPHRSKCGSHLEQQDGKSVEISC